MNKTKRAVLVVHEAAGKRVRQLSLAEPYMNSRNIYLSIEFDDETEVLIEVESRPWFVIMHLARDTHGELGPVKEPTRGTLQGLIKRKR